MVLWDHFVQYHATKTAACNYCGKILSYKSTSTNLKQHLRSMHKDAYKLLPSNKKPNPDFAKIEVWKHFVKINTEEMIARCNYCQNRFSYKSTISNLKHHLLLVHEEKCYDLFLDDPIQITNTENSNDSHNSTSVTYKRKRRTNSPIWKYFKRNQKTMISECFLCGNYLSYRSTITNLKLHLKCKHSDAYDELCKQSRTRARKEELASTSSDSDASYHSDKSDDDAEESLKITDIWNYFEEEAEKARCVVCRATMATEYEELKAHLKENHPKLLLLLLQDKEDSDAGSNNGDDDNTYTEIVYLEQEPEDVKPKEKPKYVPKPTPTVSRKRERRFSTPDDIPLKQNRSEDSDELTIFIKYITCLLKKLPPDAFSQVQIEIINTILKANSNASTINAVESSPRIFFNKELPATSVPNIITVNEVQPENSALLTHNYTITVAAKDGGEQDNS